MSGLRESVKGEWSGDVNLNLEFLNSFCKSYNERLERVMSIGLDNRKNSIEEDLDNVKMQVSEDIKYIGKSK